MQVCKKAGYIYERMLVSIKELDQLLLLTINQWHNPVLDCFFRWVTDTFFWLPLYIFLFILINKHLGWQGVMLFIGTLILSDQSVAGLFRPLFGRLRPCYALDGVRLVGTYQGIYGFPSAHASNTFSFALLFWKIFKARYSYSYLFFAWAAVISCGRVYGGVHYPLDVVFGICLGIGLGLLVYKVSYQAIGRLLRN